MPTRRAFDFTDSIGSNTHISSGGAGTPWDGPVPIQTAISYTGIRHLRDTIPYEGFTRDEYATLARPPYNVRFCCIPPGPTLDIPQTPRECAALMALVPGSVAGIEGANEFNNQTHTLNGRSSTDEGPAWIQYFGPIWRDAIRGNAALNSCKVVLASMSNAEETQIVQHGDASGFVDAGNWHIYTGNGAQPRTNMLNNINRTRNRLAPGKPVWVTEAGYNTGIGGGFASGGTPETHAMFTANMILDAFEIGAERCYIYSLIDEIENSVETDIEARFGIFRIVGGNSVAKPAATMVRNLIALLTDTGANAATFAPGTFAPTITGMPSTGYTQLLQKSNGSYWLALWNEVKIWDEPSKTVVSNPSVASVTVNFGSPMPTVREYDFLNGQTSIQTLTDATTMTLDVGPRAKLMEIVPASATPGTGGIVAGTRFMSLVNGRYTLLTA